MRSKVHKSLVSNTNAPSHPHERNPIPAEAPSYPQKRNSIPAEVPSYLQERDSIPVDDSSFPRKRESILNYHFVASAKPGFPFRHPSFTPA